MSDTFLRNPDGSLRAIIRTTGSGNLRIYEKGCTFRGEYRPAYDSTYDEGGRLVGRGNLLAMLVG